MNKVGVKFSKRSDTLYTNHNGRLVIENLSFLPDSVSFHKAGYRQSTFYFDGSVKSMQIMLQSDFSNLQEVHVYGFSTGEKLSKSPAAIHLIKTEEIQRSSTTNVAPILNKIPGVFVQTGALNTNRITIRGVGGRSPFATKNIRAFLEDIPLTDSLGETAIEDIDLETIGGMEVIKGPTSSLYGAGTGGTIIMNAAKADLNEQSISGKMLLGSYGLSKYNLTYRVNNKNTNAWVQFNDLSSEGYRDNNNFKRSSFTGFAQAFSERNSVLSLLINQTSFKGYIPSSLSLADATENPRQAAFIWGNAKGFERYLESLVGLNLKSYHKAINLSNSLSIRNKRSIERRPWDLLNNKLSSVQWRTVMSILPNPRNKIDLGFDYMWENYFNKVLVDQVLEQDFSNFVRTRNIFLTYKLSLTEHFFLDTGLSHNMFKFRGNELDGFGIFNRNRQIEGTYSFRLGLSKKSKNGNHTQFASLNNGLINPSIDQIISNEMIGVFSEELLTSEKSRSVELGARGQFKRLGYDFSIYDMLIKDRIDRSVIDEFNQGVYSNEGESTHRGVEALVYWKSRDFSGIIERFQLSIGGNYGSFLFGDYPVYRGSEPDVELVQLEGNVLTGVPDLVANAEAAVELSFGLNLRVHFQHVGEQALRDDNSIFSESHDELNFNLDYQLEFSKKWSLAANAGLRNVLDAHYYSMYSINAFGQAESARYYYPALPRNFFSGLKLTYSIN